MFLLFYNAAELFVFPSLFEGFGLPVMESLASEFLPSLPMALRCRKWLAMWRSSLIRAIPAP